MRTDIHRPSQINPKDYRFVGLKYVGPSNVGYELAAEYVKPLEAHFEKTGGKYSDHEHKGTCHVCSAGAHYLAVYYHEGTNTYIQTGFDCAAKMNMQDEAAFRVFKRKVEDARDFIAGKGKAQETLAGLGLTRCWEIWESEEGMDNFEESVITDIVGKLIKYGSISQKQEDFIKKLLGQIDERPAKEKAYQEREEKFKNADPCPEGRVTIVGEVLSIKERMTSCGFIDKMLVQSEEGFKVWGTVPSNVKVPLVLGEEIPSCIRKGDKISFSAKVTPSDDDKKFGFFSRPTKAEILETRS